MTVKKSNRKLPATLAQWQVLGTVESDSEVNTEYEITRRKKDGLMHCACPAYAFNTDRPKTCKHVTAWLATHETAVTTVFKQKQKVVEKGKMPVERIETFTVRRAITFGAVPTGGR